VTFFAYLATVSAWICGVLWGVYLTLKHLDADLSDLLAESDLGLTGLLDDVVREVIESGIAGPPSGRERAEEVPRTLPSPQGSEWPWRLSDWYMALQRAVRVSSAIISSSTRSRA
jgi:hypothetical protein